MPHIGIEENYAIGTWIPKISEFLGEPHVEVQLSEKLKDSFFKATYDHQTEEGIVAVSFLRSFSSDGFFTFSINDQIVKDVVVVPLPERKRINIFSDVGTLVFSLLSNSTNIPSAEKRPEKLEKVEQS